MADRIATSSRLLTLYFFTCYERSSADAAKKCDDAAQRSDKLNNCIGQRALIDTIGRYVEEARAGEEDRHDRGPYGFRQIPGFFIVHCKIRLKRGYS